MKTESQTPLTDGTWERSMTPKTPTVSAYRGWPVTVRGIIKTDQLSISPDGPFIHAQIGIELEQECAVLRAALIKRHSEQSYPMPQYVKSALGIA